MRRGLCGPRAQGSREHSPRSHVPSGTGGGQEDTGQQGGSCCQVALSYADWCPPPPEYPSHYGLGAVVVTAGADSRTVVAPPGVTLYLRLSRATREEGPHRINTRTKPYTWQGAGQLPQVHIPENQHNRRSPRRPAGRTEEKQVLDHATLGSSRGSLGTYSI